VRARVLTWMVRQGLLEPEEAEGMRGWDHGGGFSVEAVHADVGTASAGTVYHQTGRALA